VQHKAAQQTLEDAHSPASAAPCRDTLLVQFCCENSLVKQTGPLVLAGFNVVQHFSRSAAGVVLMLLVRHSSYVAFGRQAWLF